MENTIDATRAIELLSMTVRTLQRGERGGWLFPVGRTASNRRRYTEAKLLGHMGRRAVVPTKAIAYCRLSNSAQRPDLANHRAVLEQYGLRNYRKKLTEALEQYHAAGPSHPA